MLEKVCVKCGELKPVSDMVRSSRTSDGYTSRCKACHNALNKERYHRDLEATRAYENARKKRLYDADSSKPRACHKRWYAENSKHCVEYGARYWEQRPEKKKEHDRKYYATHKQQARERMRQWVATHREQHRANLKAHKIRRMGALVIEHFSRCEIYARDRGICHICGKLCEDTAWHLDHIIPLSRGGVHSRSNVAVSCPTCNMWKGSRIMSQLEAQQ